MRTAAVTVLVWTCLAGTVRAGEPERNSVRPLGFPIYVAVPMPDEIVIDGKLDEPGWRGSTLGWGLSHALEPNVLCPDATLFRLGYSARGLYVGLTCCKRNIQDDLPEHIWRPRESELMDTQAIERHARERGVVPPVNTTAVLISTGGRTVTLTFDPPKPPQVSVHDAMGERPVDASVNYAYHTEGSTWTVEAYATWQQLGMPVPKPGDDWALNIYRDIRFFSNWSFVGWMRQWDKAEYSRYDLTERFGRMLFAGPGDDLSAVEKQARAYAEVRGPLRIFEPTALLLVEPKLDDVRQRYAEELPHVRAYAERLLHERSRMSNDLPYYPFYPQSQPSEPIVAAGRRVTGLKDAIITSSRLADAAEAVALIRHAIPEAREGLSTFRKERLYRGLPE